MSWLNRLEAKFGHLAVPDLLRYVAALNACAFILWKLDPHYIDFLVLDRDRLLHGEVWRLVTYLFIPRIGGLFPDWFSMAFGIWYLFWIGDGLEHAWGAFRVTLYFLLGMLGTTVAVLIANNDQGGGIFYMSLFLAFARFYPESVIRFMFVLPVKVKWMAWFDGALLMFNFLTGEWPVRAAIIAAMANYFAFFCRDLIEEAQQHRQVMRRRAKFTRDMREGMPETMHRCVVCGHTEISAPDRAFRVAVDNEEYCLEHLPKPPAA